MISCWPSLKFVAKLSKNPSLKLLLTHTSWATWIARKELPYVIPWMMKMPLQLKSSRRAGAVAEHPAAEGATDQAEDEEFSTILLDASAWPLSCKYLKVNKCCLMPYFAKNVVICLPINYDPLLVTNDCELPNQQMTFF
ncbi:unnamed protein product [Prunus brigantina]